jgi:plastocyanin
MKPRFAFAAGLVALLAASPLLPACGGSSAELPVITVMVKNMAYTPAEITVAPGQTVQWIIDDGGLPHDVVGDGEFGDQLRSALMTEGTYEYTFEDLGEFGYHCTPHPSMVGAVTVEEGAASSSEAA